MKRKITALLMASVLGAGMLAGCGGSAPAEAAGDAAAESAAPAAAESAAEGAAGKTAPVEVTITQAVEETRPRVIITQDGEVDDMNSLLHTLLCANDLEIEGIVQSASKLHYSGDDTNEPLRWTGTEWMSDFMDAYEEVYPNLSVHDPNYPEPAALRAMTVVGNVTMVDEIEEDTDGSNLIKESILKEDDRPLYITVGGGANTLARALKSIEEEKSGEDGWDELHSTISKKVFIYTWGFQDEAYKNYISVSWPDITVVNVADAAICFGYRWKTASGMTEGAIEKMSSAWMQENLLNDHGAIMDRYMTWGDGTYIEGEDEDQQFGTNESMLNTEDWWGKVPYERYDFLSEGDSPTFLALLPLGLRSLEDLGYGGWGGIYVNKKYPSNETVPNYYLPKGGTNTAPWMEAIFNDFAARADWCVTPAYEDANHAPAVTVAEGLDFLAAPGEELTLHAQAEDPDGDTVTFTWSEFADADTYEGDAAIAAEGEELTVKIPEDAKTGDTIHILLTGTDDGEHTLERYQRVIVTVK